MGTICLKAGFKRKKYVKMQEQVKKGQIKQCETYKNPKEMRNLKNNCLLKHFEK